MNTNRKRLLIINSIFFLIYLAATIVVLNFELGNFVNLLAVAFYASFTGIIVVSLFHFVSVIADKPEKYGLHLASSVVFVLLLFLSVVWISSKLMQFN